MKRRGLWALALLGLMLAMALQSNVMGQGLSDYVRMTLILPVAYSTVLAPAPTIVVEFENYDLRTLAGLGMRASSIKIEIDGCGIFEQGDPGMTIDDLDPLLPPGYGVWMRGTVNLATANCQLPPGVIQVSAQATVWNVVGALRTEDLGIATDSENWSFTYKNPNPSSSNPFELVHPIMIQSLSPTTGSPGGEVIVTGSGFVQASALDKLGQTSMVYFDGEPVSTSVQSSTRLTFRVPSDALCGNHLVQIRNPSYQTYLNRNIPNTSVNMLLPVQPCSQVAEPIGSVTPLPRITSLSPEKGDANLLVEVNGSGFIRSTSTTTGSVVLWDGQPLSSSLFENTTQMSFKVPSSARCGDHRVSVRNSSGESDDEVFNIPCEQSISPPGEDPPPGGNPPPGGGNNPPPPPVNADEVEEFDTDGDCILSDTEFFAAADAWIAQQIDSALFFAALDAWIGQQNVCTASASDNPIRLSTSLHGVSIESEDSLGVVKIYDTGGREVFSQNTKSNKLVWNLRTTDGNALANGVYFVSIANTGELRKVMLLR